MTYLLGSGKTISGGEENWHIQWEFPYAWQLAHGITPGMGSGGININADYWK